MDLMAMFAVSSITLCAKQFSVEFLAPFPSFFPFSNNSFELTGWVDLFFTIFCRVWVQLITQHWLNNFARFVYCSLYLSSSMYLRSASLFIAIEFDKVFSHVLIRRSYRVSLRRLHVRFCFSLPIYRYMNPWERTHPTPTLQIINPRQIFFLL